MGKGGRHAFAAPFLTSNLSELPRKHDGFAGIMLSRWLRGSTVTDQSRESMAPKPTPSKNLPPLCTMLMTSVRATQRPAIRDNQGTF
jgi:hypothetical protein